MRTARTVLILVVAALTTVLLAAPASAGGPTSVLLVVPGGGGTAGLYYDDPQYAELARLLGHEGLGGTGQQAGNGHETGTTVTATWLIHDVQVWRVDRIYLGGSGGPWVASQTGYGESIWDAPVTWYRPAEPKALLQLLGTLGLDPGSGSGGVPIVDTEEVPAPSEQPRTNPEARPSAPVEEETGTPWLLLALAAAGGAVLAAAVTVPLTRRAGSSPAPVLAADEVTPVGPAEPVGPSLAVAALDDDDPAWSPAEQLARR